VSIAKRVVLFTTEFKVLNAPENITSLNWFDENTLVCGLSDGKLCVFDLASGSNRPSVLTLPTQEAVLLVTFVNRCLVYAHYTDDCVVLNACNSEFDATARLMEPTDFVSLSLFCDRAEGPAAVQFSDLPAWNLALVGWNSNDTLEVITLEQGTWTKLIFEDHEQPRAVGARLFGSALCLREIVPEKDISENKVKKLVYSIVFCNGANNEFTRFTLVNTRDQPITALGKHGVIKPTRTSKSSAQSASSPAPSGNSLSLNQLSQSLPGFSPQSEPQPLTSSLGPPGKSTFTGSFGAGSMFTNSKFNAPKEVANPFGAKQETPSLFGPKQTPAATPTAAP
jgi:hypothetical protein